MPSIARRAELRHRDALHLQAVGVVHPGGDHLQPWSWLADPDHAESVALLAHVQSAGQRVDEQHVRRRAPILPGSSRMHWASSTPAYSVVTIPPACESYHRKKHDAAVL
ncbi:hypothetical protein SNK04_014140 [Fusarium graminearum]